MEILIYVMLIVPDIHGRTFWKDVMRSPEDIIFLGDYLDPYEEEGISADEALENFREILKFKKENPGRVTLLLGNHDLSYIYPWMECSRHNDLKEKEIGDIFEDSRELFKLSHTLDGRYVFSHAGFNPIWVRKHFGDMRILEVAEENQFSPESLYEISGFRRGWDSAGSIVWADVREFRDEDFGCYQIFGHTQLREPYWGENFACLDCRKICGLSL